MGENDSSELCHDFASHMGPVNANHFLPQAQGFYARYHALALGRAAACKAMGEKLGVARTRFAPFLKDCELEALTLEAVGQHFLQDAWSMGHMWQRWGSPNLADFPPGPDQRDRAVLVALGSGLIHGSRGVLQRLPDWSTFDVNDALCAPHAQVQFVRDDGQVLAAIGDDYLSLLPPFGGQGDYQAQSERLFSCAASGMLQVYQAAGSQHGAAAPPAAGLSTFNPLGPECFAQRATNASILVGEAVQLKVAGQQTSLTLDSRFVGWLVPKVARSQGLVPVSARLRNQFRFDLQRIVSVSRLLAAEAPLGTELAEGRVGDFLGVKPNGAFDVSFAPYVDPPLPWPSSPDLSVPAQQRATTLARLFHRAHAADWCALTDDAALAALKAHVADGTLDAPSTAGACAACEELVVRHLRVGSDAAHYDLTRAPLCDYLSPASGHVYQANLSPSPAVLARASCGCP